MITEAIVIGALDCAIYRDEAGYKALRLEEQGSVDCTRDIHLLMASNAEKRHLNPVPQDLQELMTALQQWSDRHVLLKMLVSTMDPICRAATRSQCLALAEEYMADSQLYAFAEARMLGCPLPDQADLAGAIDLSQPFKNAHQLYQRLENSKGAIANVLKTLKTLIYFDSQHNHDPDELLRVMVDQGLVSKAVQAMAACNQKAIKNLLFDFITNPLFRPQQNLLTQFINRLIEQLPAPQQASTPKATTITEVTVEQAAESDAVSELINQWRDDSNRNQNIRFTANVEEKTKKQKQYILAELAKGREQKVQQGLMSLVEYHHQTGKLFHLCKSLSDLGARAKDIHQFEFALKVYGYARQANDKDAFVLTGYAETLRSMGRLDEALKAYTETKTQFPNDEVAMNGYAETLRSMGRLDEALKAYTETKTQFPNNVVAMNGFAETLRSMGRLDEALKAYTETKTQFPNNDVAMNGFAETLRSLGRLDEALKAYTETKTQFPNDEVAMNGFAETLRSMGRLDEALKAYTETKTQFPNDVVAMAGFAETLRSMGRLDDALAAYSAAKTQFPNNVFAITGHAETLRSMGRLDEALKAYTETKTQFPNNVVAMTGYAETLRSMGRLDEALKAYTETKTQFPNDVVAMTGHAETLRSMGRLDEALKAYTQTKEKFEHDRVVSNALACLYIELDQFDKASALLANVSEQPKTLQDWRDLHVLAMSYLKQGQFEQAQALIDIGAAGTPFVQSSRIFKNTSWLLQLRLNQPQGIVNKIETTEVITFPISGLLYAQALAKAQRQAEVAGVLGTLTSKDSNVIQLRDYLSQRYSTLDPLSVKAQKGLDEKIDQATFNLVLRAA